MGMDFWSREWTCVDHVQRLGSRLAHVPDKERVLYFQPTGPNPLYHRDDQVDRPRAMAVSIPFSR